MGNLFNKNQNNSKMNTSSDGPKEELPAGNVAGKAPTYCPCDLSMMLEEMDGDLSVLEKIVKVVLDGTPARLEKLQEHLSAADAVAFAGEAHTIKGLMSYLGSPRLVDSAYELEKAGRKGNLAGIQKKVDIFNEEIKIVMKYFTETNWQEGLKKK